MQHPVVSHTEWLTAAKALFAKELAMTHELDALRAERRRLPWAKVEKPYIFDSPAGKCPLVTSSARSQLAVYHFMLDAGLGSWVPGLLLHVDHDDAARHHFAQRTSLSPRSPSADREDRALPGRMGWTFPWVSSGDTDFGRDFRVSFTQEDRAAGRAIYNYGTVIRKSRTCSERASSSRTRMAPSSTATRPIIAAPNC